MANTNLKLSAQSGWPLRFKLCYSKLSCQTDHAESLCGMGEDMPGCGDWMKNFLQAPCPVSSHCHTGSVLSDWPLRIQAVGHFGSPSRLEWPPKVLEGQQEELHQDLESFESSFNALERAQAVFHRNQSLWIKQLLEGHQEDSLEIQIRGFLQVFFLRLFPKV